MKNEKRIAEKMTQKNYVDDKNQQNDMTAYSCSVIQIDILRIDSAQNLKICCHNSILSYEDEYCSILFGR